MNSLHRLDRVLILSGVATPLLFWATLALCAARFPGYSHLTHQVSELGAVGTATRALFATGLLLCSLASLALVVGLFRACRRSYANPLPALLILLFTFSIAGAAIVPMPYPLHGILGSPSILLLLSPLLALALWRGVPGLRYLAPLAVASFLLMALGFLVFVPDVLGAQSGLKQRFFHAGWSLWFVYLSVGFMGLPGRRSSSSCAG